MKTRTRLFAAFLALAGVGFYALVDWIRDDLVPRYLAVMEETMVDTAEVLSAFLANQMEQGRIPVDGLRQVFGAADARRFSARIYELTKTRTNLRVYVTDKAGIVVFDSDNGRDEGKDYSRWNDVVRTFRGEYGARTTHMVPGDPSTAILYVASPIVADGQTAGVLTVCKPAASVALFLDTARRDIAFAGVVAAAAVMMLGMIVSLWITRPIEKLTKYAQAVRDGKRAAAPRLGRSEIGELGAAFEEMRTALEGRQYVENYVQTLTHEMKAPLCAIRGAAELLEEDMPPDQRRQFLANLRSESERIQDLIDRMLQLSALENRKELRDVEEIDLAALADEVVEDMKPVFSGKRIDVSVLAHNPVVVRGERFLIRQAAANLLQNAIDFSNEGGRIAVSVENRGDFVEMVIVDSGPGVPNYARDKVFDRFYSLRRPDTGKKSSGLGLAFAREAAELHGGRVSLDNRPEGGAKARLLLPVRPQPATL